MVDGIGMTSSSASDVGHRCGTTDARNANCSANPARLPEHAASPARRIRQRVAEQPDHLASCRAVLYATYLTPLIAGSLPTSEEPVPTPNNSSVLSVSG